MTALRISACLALTLGACDRVMTLGDDRRAIEQCGPDCAADGGGDSTVDAGDTDAGATDDAGANADGGCTLLTDCTLVCEHGFARTPSGCELCSCAATPLDAGCGPTFCQMPCRFGYKRTARGCGLCQCSPMPSPVCLPPNCGLTCANGFILDSAGCQLCECSPR